MSCPPLAKLPAQPVAARWLLPRHHRAATLFGDMLTLGFTRGFGQYSRAAARLRGGFEDGVWRHGKAMLLHCCWTEAYYAGRADSTKPNEGMQCAGGHPDVAAKFRAATSGDFMDFAVR